jgi:DNA-binding PadR family transcriptional regulator
LVVLAEGPLHGYRLVERIGELPGFAGQKPDASGVYRLLKTMERKGLVASAWNTSESGPAKKSYQITCAGQQCLRRWIRTLESFRRGISGLLAAARKADHDQTKENCCCE